MLLSVMSCHVMSEYIGGHLDGKLSPGTVLVDVRNNYEIDIGTFQFESLAADGSKNVKSAINPNTRQVSKCSNSFSCYWRGEERNLQLLLLLV